MSPGLQRLVLLAGAVTALTGLALVALVHVLGPGPEPEDPAAALDYTGRHPWADEARDLHLLAVPLALFALGAVWLGHAAPRLRGGGRARRASGAWLLLGAAALAYSGVALQLVAGPDARAATSLAHAALGVLWCLAFAAHTLRRG